MKTSKNSGRGGKKKPGQGVCAAKKAAPRSKRLPNSHFTQVDHEDLSASNGLFKSRSKEEINECIFRISEAAISSKNLDDLFFSIHPPGRTSRSASRKFPTSRTCDEEGNFPLGSASS
jgi:hypothetical protein